MRGFFEGSTLAKKAPTAGLLPKCGACGLYKGCQSPKMQPSGEGRRGVLLVGDAPGETEDEQDLQFVGKSGRMLEDVLFKLGVDMRRDCWITTALICRPPGNKIPNDRMVDYCRPNLIKTVKELNPRVVVLLGSVPVQSFISEVWKESPGGVGKWAGHRIPCQKPNLWICPTYHPSGVQRSHHKVRDMEFELHLKRAFELEGRPWSQPPDYDARVEIVMDTDRAAKILRKMKERGGAIAGDYENNCLLPQTPGGEIVSCAMCWRGVKTIAYPWHGAAIEATRELWHADNCWFIASNLKHENRWTLHDAGRPVRHWLWDTMVAAHVLDSRPEICSLKFQAFVRLGAEAYDEHLKPYLQSSGGKALNRIRTEINLHQLLQYDGTDALLEYLTAEHQMREMGFDPPLTNIVNDAADKKCLPALPRGFY